MYLIEVIPITKARAPETLSYFHTRPLETGCIAQVPLRKKNVRAMVLSSTDVRNMKSVIRRSDFSLKKIHSVEADILLSEAFIEASQETSRFFLTPLSKVLYEVAPREAFTEASSFTDKKAETNKERKILGIEAPFSERVHFYKTEIKKLSKNGELTLILCPTALDAKNIGEAIGGEDSGAVVFHGKQSPKERLSSWKRAHDPETRVLIGTAGILAVKRKDLALIIIERESSDAYKTFSNPSFDLTFFARSLGEYLEIDVLQGDFLLRSETVQRSSDVHSKRVRKPLCISALRDSEDKFHIITKIAKKEIKNALENDKKVFIYSGKRGAGTIVCMDCGKGADCKNCGAPIVLHENNFACHACGEERSAKEVCSRCQSWNLKEYGIGSESVEKALKESLSQDLASKIYRIDSDTVSKERDVVAAIKSWHESGGVVIGTAKALPYIKNADLGIVSSFESVSAFPSIDSNERSIRLLLAIEDFAGKLIVQAHDKNHPILNFFAEEDMSNFRGEENQKRKKFFYPPWSILVKITTNIESEEALKAIAGKLTPYNPAIYHSYPSKTSKESQAHILLKINPEEWPIKETGILTSLPHEFTLEVNPKSVF